MPIRISLTLLLLSAITLDAWAQAAKVQIIQGRRPRPIRVNPNAGVVVPGAEIEEEIPGTDEEILESVGLKAADPEAIIKYLQQWTLSEQDRATVLKLIERFGDDDFKVRQQASQSVIKMGPTVVPLLRVSRTQSKDPEVIYRIDDSLRRLERVPISVIAGAAIRTLGKSDHPKACQIMLDFLTLAETSATFEVIRTGLALRAVRADKIDPTLTQELDSKDRRRASYAALAIVEGSSRKSRPDDLQAKLVDLASSERDAEQRYRILFALATRSNEPKAIEPLLEIYSTLPRARQWVVEDFFITLAGDTAPKKAIGAAGDGIPAARDLWLKWWKENDKRLANFTYKPRIAGRIIAAWSKQNAENGIVELNPDGTERWNIPTKGYVQILADGPNGGIVHSDTSEMGAVHMRDSDGHLTDSPALKKLNFASGNGLFSVRCVDNNLLVTNGGTVIEQDPEKADPAMKHSRNQFDIVDAVRTKEGTLLMTRTLPHAIMLNAKGEEVKGFKLPIATLSQHPGGCVTPIEGEKILVAEMNQVVEYDLATKKATGWRVPAEQPTSVIRLPNGNTLVMSYQFHGHQRSIIQEYNAARELVWSQLTPQGVWYSKILVR